jgi:hypothetical protein
MKYYTMYTIRKSTPTGGDIRTTAEFVILEGAKKRECRKETGKGVNTQNY